MTTWRTDTFVVGPIIEDTMPLLMCSAPTSKSPDGNSTMSFVSFLTPGPPSDIENRPIFDEKSLSDTVFADLDSRVSSLYYVTINRVEDPRIEDGRIYHQCVIKVYTNRNLSFFVGYLTSTPTVVSELEVITLYTDEPATYPELPILASVNYYIEGMNTSVTYCTESGMSEELRGTPIPDIPLYEALDDLLDTDLSDDDENGTSWCRAASSYSSSASFPIFFLPVTWYDQYSCTPSSTSNSMLGFNSFFPSAGYFIQCFANNNNRYNDSQFCQEVRDSIFYTTQNTCRSYSPIGKYFYGPNVNSSSCGNVVSNYHTLLLGQEDGDPTMLAQSTVGTCEEGACIINDNMLSCTDQIINEPIIEEQEDELEEDDDPWWQTQKGIIAIVILSAVILIVIVIVTVVLTMITKDKSKKQVIIRRSKLT